MSKRMVSSGRRAGGGGGDGEEARGAADLEDLGLALGPAAATLENGFDFLPFGPSSTVGASVDDTESSTAVVEVMSSTGRGVSTSSIGTGEWCAGDEEGGGDDEPSSDADSAEARSSGTSSGGHFDVARGDVHR